MGRVQAGKENLSNPGARATPSASPGYLGQERVVELSEVAKSREDTAPSPHLESQCIAAGKELLRHPQSV